MADAFEIVRAGYDRIGEKYRDWSAAGVVRIRWVDWLLAQLPPHSIIVDLGCGSGEPATRLLANMHHVIGIDASAAQLALARSAVPTALLIQADIARFALRPESVDTVASFYALGHVPSHLHVPLLSSIASWLRPGGLLLTSAPVSAGDEKGDSWLGVPIFFGGIGMDATRQAIADVGLHLENMEVVAEDEGGGHLVRFIWIIAKKPTGGLPGVADPER